MRKQSLVYLSLAYLLIFQFVSAEDIFVRISPTKKQFYLSEPYSLNLEIKNNSKTKVHLLLGLWGNMSFSYDGKLNGESLPSNTTLPNMSGLGPVFVLGSGEKFISYLFPRYYLQMNRVGFYEINIDMSLLFFVENPKNQQKLNKKFSCEFSVVKAQKGEDFITIFSPWANAFASDDWQVRNDSARALISSQSEHSLNVFVENLDAINPSIKRLAIYSMGATKSAASLSKLKEILYSGDMDLVDEVLYVIQNFHIDELFGDVMELYESGVISKNRRAQEFINALNHQRRKKVLNVKGGQSQSQIE